MKTTIVFQPEDKQLPQLILEATYSFHEGEPMVMYLPDGSGYPGSPATVEVESVVLDYVDVDGNIDNGDLAVWFGALAYAAYPKQIDKLVMEAHCEESQGDPDRERE